MVNYLKAYNIIEHSGILSYTLGWIAKLKSDDTGAGRQYTQWTSGT
jgi:hypothetical protein